MDAYVTVYKPIAGWKAVLLVKSEDGYFEPYNTSYFAFKTKAEAVIAAKSMAEAEEVPFVDDDVVDDSDAPDKSVTEQLLEIFGGNNR